MSARLVLFAGGAPEEACAWRRVAEGGRVTDRGESAISDLNARGADILLVLPGYQVSAHEITLAAKSERQARAAAPFAIEDSIAGDIEDLHIVLSAPSKTTPADRVVYAVDAGLMDAWVEALATAGLSAQACLPDYLAAPGIENEISVVSLPDRIIVRDDLWGAAVDRDLGDVVLDAMLSARSEERSVNQISDGDLLDALAAGAAHAPTNLMQGRYAARRDRSGLDISRWTGAAAALASAVVAISVVNFVEGRALAAEAETVRGETRRIFQEAFPEVTRVVNPRAQLRALSREQTGLGQPEFLILSARIAAAAERTDGVLIDSVRYDQERGELSAGIVFETYDDLAALRADIEAAGVVFEEGGSRDSGGRRTGDFKVRLP